MKVSVVIPALNGEKWMTDEGQEYDLLKIINEIDAISDTKNIIKYEKNDHFRDATKKVKEKKDE